jgi:histidinol-phosphate aminotransferase
MSAPSPAEPLPSYEWEPTTDFLAARYGLPPEAIVRYDVNTSPLPPDLRDVLAGPFVPVLSEYPPSDYAALVAAATAAYDVSPDELLPTAGADEALDLSARAFLRQGSVAIAAVPTYAMYRIVTEQRGAQFHGVPRQAGELGFGLDIPSMVEAARSADLVWLCEPNNPTGTAESPARIEALLDRLAANALVDCREAPAVVVDEAYAEFTGSSTLGLRGRYPRLVVIRTLSKAHGLAGIRVGFAAARPDTLAPILSFRAPASVSTVSAALASAALSRPGLAEVNVARIGEQRARLIAELSEIGWRPYPSRVNFILIRFSSPTGAAAAAETLLRAGLVPRTFGADHLLADCLRLTVRSAGENDRLIATARGIPA